MDIDTIKQYSPCIIYRESELVDNLAAFRDAFQSAWQEGRILLGYSVKTAPIAALVSLSHMNGYLAEVVSDDEYDLALSAGLPECDIIFNGPVKSREYLFRAYDCGAIVNIDSQRELRWTCEYAELYQRMPKVGLRINYDLESQCPSSTPAGEEGCRFGFCYENGILADAISVLRDNGIEPAGIHAHFSSSTRSTEVYRSICNTVCKIADEYGLNSLSYVDIGGGYYGGGANKSKYQEYAEVICSVLMKHFDPHDVALVLEPGGSVLATAATYYGRVLDVKHVRNSIFAVTELSKLNLNSTAFSRRFSRLERPELQSDKCVDTISNQIVCGYTCMEMDRICDLRDEPLLQEGELVGIRFAGAYACSFAPHFFIKKRPSLFIESREGKLVPIEWPA